MLGIDEDWQGFKDLGVHLSNVTVPYPWTPFYMSQKEDKKIT